MIIGSTPDSSSAEISLGWTVFIPPIYSDVPLDDGSGRMVAGAATMFFATPLRDASQGHGVRADERLRGAHLLLVEDNEINQQVATELLELAGLEVTIANHGREALDTLNADANAFDGVLMDIQMPVMDGYTATRELRTDPRFKQLPVIAMTANAMAKDREQALNAGMNDHVAKPIDVKELFTVLIRWVEVAGERRAAADAATMAPGAESRATKKAAPAEIPLLDGIDTEAGLKRMSGNTGLYLKILRKFRDSQGDFEKRFRAALVDDDPDAATRCAHTLKGVAGNIGATGVDELLPLMAGSAHAGLLARLVDQVDDYAFEEARDVLDELQRTL